MNLSSFWDRVQKKLPPFIRKDFGRKVAALLLASMVFTYFQSQDASETVKLEGIPVSIQLPPDYTLGNLKNTVTLEVRVPKGGRLSHQKVRSQEIVVSASDIAKDKETKIRLSKNSFHVPFYCHVERVIPENLLLNIDREVTKEVTVKAVLDGTAADGYSAAIKVIEPARVSVTAPESLLKNLSSIQTEKIDISDKQQNFEYFSPLVRPGDGVKLAREKVLVKVMIRKKTRYQTFSSIEIAILQGNNSSIGKVELLKQHAVSVRVSGDGEGIERLQKSDIKVFADVSHFREPGVYHVDLECLIAVPGISVDMISPKSIQVRVTK